VEAPPKQESPARVIAMVLPSPKRLFVRKKSTPGKENSLLQLA
jgi:glutaredoxin domain-containing cysteine-rich protein 1